MKDSTKPYQIAFLLILVLIAVMIAVFWVGHEYISLELKKYRTTLEAELTQKLAMPVSIKEISLDWYQLQPVVKVENFHIYDNQTNIPIFFIEETRVHLSLIDLILHQSFELKRLDLISPRCLILWEPNHQLEILGLGGEKVEDQVGLQPVLGILDKLSEVNIEYGDIHIKSENSDFPLTQVELNYSKSSREEAGLFVSAALAAPIPSYVSGSLDIKGRLIDLDNLGIHAEFSGWGLELTQWEKIFKYTDKAQLKGKGTFELSLDYQNKRLQSFKALTRIINFEAINKHHKYAISLPMFQGEYLLKTDQLNQVNAFEAKHVFHGKGEKKYDAQFMLERKENNQIHFGAKHLTLKDPFVWFLINEKLSPKIIDQMTEQLLDASIDNAKWAYDLNDSKLIIHQMDGNTQLNHLDVFKQGFNLQFRDLGGEITVRKGELQIQTNKFSIHTPYTQGQAKCALIFEEGKDRPYVDITADITELNLQTGMKNYLPYRVFNDELKAWFNRAMDKGRIISGNLRLKGDLAQFPFADGQDGIYRWSMDFESLDLNYTENWPPMKNLTGKLEVNGRQYNIDIASGEVVSQPIKVLKGKIFPVAHNEQAVLYLEGLIDFPVQAGLDFLLNTPLKADFIELQSLKPTGQIKLDLNLKIPLSEGENTFEMNLELDDGSLSFNVLDLKATKIQGKLDITDKTMTSSQLTTEMLGEKFKVDVLAGLKEHPNELRVELKGPLNINQLLNTYQIDQIKGKTDSLIRYRSSWKTNDTLRKIQITSDLKGVLLDFPSPLSKPHETPVKSSVEFNLGKQPLIQTQFQLGKILNGKLKLDTEKDPTLRNGHLAFGEAQSIWQSGQKMKLTGDINALDWQDWENVLSLDANGKPLPYVFDINLFTKQLPVFGQTLPNIRLIYVSEEDKKNNLIFDGETMKGKLIFPKKEEPLTIDLNHLNIQNDIQPFSVAGDRPDFENYHALDFNCNQLTYKKINLGKISFNLVPNRKGFRVKNIRNQSKPYILAAEGSVIWEEKIQTQFDGSVVIKDFGQTLTGWGYSSALKKGAGDIDFNLGYRGLPSDFSIKRITGKAVFDFKGGRISGVDPGLGRIMGLLSLENIQRRMKLDFSDFFQEGFAYDVLKTEMNFSEGLAKSDEILVDGPSARITLSGQANLETKQVDYLMMVVPKVSGSLPIAAAIAAGNPAVGAALWMLNQSVQSQITDLTQYIYKVEGTWEKPNIKSLGEKKTKSTPKPQPVKPNDNDTHPESTPESTPEHTIDP